MLWCCDRYVDLIRPASFAVKQAPRIHRSLLWAITTGSIHPFSCAVSPGTPGMSICPENSRPLPARAI